MKIQANVHMHETCNTSLSPTPPDPHPPYVK